MIKLSNIKIPAAIGDTGLTPHIASLLGVSEQDIREITILKRSVDARRKSDVSYVYTVALATDSEESILKKSPDHASLYTPPEPYTFTYKGTASQTPPVVIGMGPAGLFAALCLAEAGLKPILLERGRPVEERVKDVERFWLTGVLNESSNVQFGEGGAGTFSDGKLTTGISDARIPYILKRFVEFGAPEDILFLAKPHIGTDKLRRVVIALRQELLRLGGDIRFGHRLTGLVIEDGQVTHIDAESEDGAYRLATRQVILAPGNSARDTFEMLERDGIKLSAKSFSVGVRIEHLQKNINLAQYGPASTLGTLPAADYKLAVHLASGRSVYTFCVCPGGRIIAAASEHGHVVINGMSTYARTGKNCNGGMLVSVTPDDFDGSALAGMRFQTDLEKTAFVHGGESNRAPAQQVSDFLLKQPSTGAGRVQPTYSPGVTWCNLWDFLPTFVCEAIAEALPQMEKRIRGFSAPDAVLTAVETRSSSPVRINRTDYQADGITGLFPCGEGAGYAGGIMSAAVDGIRAAETLCTLI